MSITDRPTVKAETLPDEVLGQMLGRYKLLERIGEGGFGVVYARALYVQSLAESLDASGLARRRDELNQAERLLQGLTDEARQLHDSKELLSWISAERKNLKAPRP